MRRGEARREVATSTTKRRRLPIRNWFWPKPSSAAMSIRSTAASGVIFGFFILGANSPPEITAEHFRRDMPGERRERTFAAMRIQRDRQRGSLFGQRTRRSDREGNERVESRRAGIDLEPTHWPSQRNDDPSTSTDQTYNRRIRRHGNRTEARVPRPSIDSSVICPPHSSRRRRHS